MLLLLCSDILIASEPYAASPLPPRPNKAEVFFLKASQWVDDFVMKGLDTAYIGLPEHSWRIAFTSGMVGINSAFTTIGMDTTYYQIGDIFLLTRTTPSVNLGFNIGFRGFGFGYSWDALHAYSRNLNFSLGSKVIGVEFSHQTTTNLAGVLGASSFDEVYSINDSLANKITNTSLSVWYALNSAHYSHNAAIKQGYIQKKTAGSLLLEVAYKSTRMDIDPTLSLLLGKVSSIETNQVGVGLGYGINYTPNRGKVLLHFAGMAQLICYSKNLIAEQEWTISPDGSSMKPSLEKLYRIDSRYPVHVTGTLRAAVSWEINKWVHLSAWARGNNLRFMARASDVNVKLSDWNWTVNLHIGVRLGVGEEKRRRLLEAERAHLLAEEGLLTAPVETDSATRIDTPQQPTPKKTYLPSWITGYFFSPRH